MSKRVNVGEEVVEMERDTDGTYKSTAVVKVNPPQAIPTSLKASHHPPMILRGNPVVMEFLDGFVMGLEALENFMVNVKKFGKRGKAYDRNIE